MSILQHSSVVASSVSVTRTTSQPLVPARSCPSLDPGPQQNFIIVLLMPRLLQPGAAGVIPFATLVGLGGRGWKGALSVPINLKLLFHSLALPVGKNLVNMSAACSSLLVISTTIEPSLTRSCSQAMSTLWVRPMWRMVGFLPVMIMRMAAVLSSLM